MCFFVCYDSYKLKTNKKSMFKLFNHCHSRAQIQQKVDYKAQSGNY